MQRDLTGLLQHMLLPLARLYQNPRPLTSKQHVHVISVNFCTVDLGSAFVSNQRFRFLGETWCEGLGFGQR